MFYRDKRVSDKTDDNNVEIVEIKTTINEHTT